MIIDFDAHRKKKARERRLARKQKRLRHWQGERSTDFAVLRAHIERQRGMTALRAFFGPCRAEPVLIFRPKVDPYLWRGARTHKEAA